MVPLILLFPLVGMAAQEQGQVECTNLSATRTVGIGMLSIHDKIGISARYWISDTDGSELALLAPSRGGRLSFLAKGLRKVLDTCYIDGCVNAGVEIPVGDTIDWQGFYMSGEIEWSLSSRLAVTLEGGVNITHWHSRWSSSTYIALNFHLYPG
jgi:hypothetical protein